MTTEEFIQKAKAVHGDKYDYSHVVYVNSRTKVCIICPKHGEFLQTPDSHLRGHGCSKCYYERNSENNSDWTYERCYAEAQKYKTKTAFNKGSHIAYNRANYKGWIADYKWFVRNFVLEGGKRKIWTKEVCFKEAQKYKTKKEFQQSNSSAYSIACKNGWIVDYDWLVDKRIDIIKDRIDCVYAYFFKETNAVYIGRTIRKRDRDYQHIFTTDRDTVAKYAKELGLPVPSMLILEESLTLKEGQAKEDYWKNYYAAQGFTLLNKAGTGVGIGSLGSIGYGKWTKNTCYEEAKKYTSRSSFELANGSAYEAARKRGWLKDYTWFEELKTPKAHWTYDRCFEEAQKCKTLKEFYRKFEKPYRVALKRGWIKDYTWFIQPKPKIKWTYEACMEKAKTCRSKIEFETKFPGAINVARKNNWLKDYTWFKRPAAQNIKWTFETCQIEARKYLSRGEFAKRNKAAYLKSWKNGWLDKLFPNKRKEVL